MRLIVAYLLVIPLVPFCLTLGALVPGFLVALSLTRAPKSLRISIAGIVAGVSGVALAVVWGYGVFYFLAGPGSFTVAPFLASTVPLLPPICKHLFWARRVAVARQAVVELAEKRGADIAAKMANQTQTAHGTGVLGEILGLVLAGVWFITR